MCKEISTGEVLSMKVLKKRIVIADDDYDSVLTENNVLRKMKHPFLTVSYMYMYVALAAPPKITMVN